MRHILQKRTQNNTGSWNCMSCAALLYIICLRSYWCDHLCRSLLQQQFLFPLWECLKLSLPLCLLLLLVSQQNLLLCSERGQIPCSNSPHIVSHMQPSPLMNIVCINYARRWIHCYTYQTYYVSCLYTYRCASLFSSTDLFHTGTFAHLSFSLLSCRVAIIPEMSSYYTHTGTDVSPSTSHLLLSSSAPVPSSSLVPFSIRALEHTPRPPPPPLPPHPSLRAPCSPTAVQLLQQQAFCSGQSYSTLQEEVSLTSASVAHLGLLDPTSSMKERT